MTKCNYIQLDTNAFEPESLYLEELFDLDVLCTEEGIFINIPSE